MSQLSPTCAATVLSLALGVWAAGGCSRQPGAKPEDSPPPTAESTGVREVENTGTAPPDQLGTHEKHTILPAGAAEQSEPPSSPKGTDSPPAEVVEEPVAGRWLFYSPRVTALIELQSAVLGGQDNLARLIELADTDGNGATSWTEISELSALFPQPPDTQPLPPDLAHAYDSDGDGTVGCAELQRFLCRGLLVVSDWLVLEIDGRYERQIASPLFNLLDQDNSGQLESSELEEAPARLRRQDADDDGLLWPADFQGSGLTNLMAAPRASMSTLSAQKYVCPIDDETEWDQLAFELEQRFSYGAPLTPEDLPALSPLKQLDELGDGDGLIEPSELEALAKSKPSATLQFEWDTGRLLLGGEQTSEMDSAVGEDVTSRVRIDSHALALDATVNLGESLSTFSALDRNEDGVLNQQEFASARVTMGVAFESVDADENREINEAEYGKAKAVHERLRGRFVVGRISRAEDPLFQILDLNGDGRLERREVDSSQTSVNSLTSMQSESISRNDLAASLSIVFTRGLVSSLAEVQPAPQHSLPDTPTWFVQMDMDGNGELDRHEFLGRQERFVQLDQNSDDYISREEAANFSD